MGRTIKVNGDLILKPAAAADTSLGGPQIAPKAIDKLLEADESANGHDGIEEKDQVKIKAATKARLLLEQSYVQKWQ